MSNTIPNVIPSVILINSLNFNYNNQDKVLNNLSLDIKQGQLTCLLGSNGAGKTTLINLLLGRLTQMSGTISYFSDQQSIGDVRERVAAMLQNSTAPEKAKVGELLTLFSSYYHQPIPLNQLISQLNLSTLLNQRFGLLSGGQKQLVLLALAMCGNPDILFLDEPSVGMDVTARRTLWQAISQYQSLGKTIILTTHYLEEADALADRIIVLQDGSIAADGSPTQLKSAFEHKTIKAKTTKSIHWLQQMPAVKQVVNSGHYVEVFTSKPALTLKYWLNNDNSLADFTVNSADLEQAFLQLTSTDNNQSPMELAS